MCDMSPSQESENAQPRRTTAVIYFYNLHWSSTALHTQPHSFAPLLQYPCNSFEEEYFQERTVFCSLLFSSQFVLLSSHSNSRRHVLSYKIREWRKLEMFRYLIGLNVDPRV